MYRWWKSFVQTAYDSMTVWWQVLNIYATHIYIYIYKGLTTDRTTYGKYYTIQRAWNENNNKHNNHSTHIPLQCSTVWISVNRMSGCRIIVCQNPVSVTDRVQYIRGWWGVCGVTGTSSVQSDCLWKELVSQSAGEGSAITSVWW